MGKSKGAITHKFFSVSVFPLPAVCLRSFTGTFNCSFFPHFLFLFLSWLLSLPPLLITLLVRWDVFFVVWVWTEEAERWRGMAVWDPCDGAEGWKCPGHYWQGLSGATLSHCLIILVPGWPPPKSLKSPVLAVKYKTISLRDNLGPRSITFIATASLAACSHFCL